MSGYFNNEQANQETFDSDGWMRSGDIGYYDKDGYIYIVDRMKELIKVKGMQVCDYRIRDVLKKKTGIFSDMCAKGR